MKHTLLGLSADEWAEHPGLPPYAPLLGGPVTVADVRAAVIAFLRTLDECSPEHDPHPR